MKRTANQQPNPAPVSNKERARRARMCVPIADPERWQRRVEAINALGGRCECCGESEPMFLSFDHIEGVGNAPCRAAGRRGDALIKWMQKRGFDVRGVIRILCLNCHQAITWTGTCPHQQKGET